MFVWVRAATLPRVIVSTETTIKTWGQSIVPERSQGESPGRAKPPKKKRSMIAKPAALGATERNAVTGVGAPWYTSGHQKWKGTAAVLNPKPASTSSVISTTARRLVSVT